MQQKALAAAYGLLCLLTLTQVCSFKCHKPQNCTSESHTYPFEPLISTTRRTVHSSESMWNLTSIDDGALHKQLWLDYDVKISALCLTGAKDAVTRNRPDCGLCIPHLADDQLFQPGTLWQQPSRPQHILHKLPHSRAEQGQAVHAEWPLLHCAVSSPPTSNNSCSTWACLLRVPTLSCWPWMLTCCSPISCCTLHAVLE